MRITKLESPLSPNVTSIVSLLTPALITIVIGITSAHADTTIDTNTDTAIESESILQSQNSASAKKGISVGLNVVATGTPYDTDDSNITLLPSLFYDNGKVYVRGIQLGAYLINNQQTEVAAFVQPAGFSFDPDAAKGNLQGLDEREWSGMLGASYLRRTPIGGFRAQVATDVMGNSDGTTANVAYLARVKKGSWTVYPSIGLEWASDDYNNYYFGVSAKESTQTGVSTYTADASISPFASINANYDINQDWALFLGQRVDYLSEEQNDSPIVDNRLTYRSTVGLLYQF